MMKVLTFMTIMMMMLIMSGRDRERPLRKVCWNRLWVVFSSRCIPSWLLNKSEIIRSFSRASDQSQMHVLGLVGDSGALHKPWLQGSARRSVVTRGGRFEVRSSERYYTSCAAFAIYHPTPSANSEIACITSEYGYMRVTNTTLIIAHNVSGLPDVIIANIFFPQHLVEGLLNFRRRVCRSFWLDLAFKDPLPGKNGPIMIIFFLLMYIYWTISSLLSHSCCSSQLMHQNIWWPRNLILVVLCGRYRYNRPSTTRLSPTCATCKLPTNSHLAHCKCPHHSSFEGNLAAVFSKQSKRPSSIGSSIAPK